MKNEINFNNKISENIRDSYRSHEDTEENLNNINIQEEENIKDYNINQNVQKPSLMDNPLNEKNIQRLCKYFEESFKQEELTEEYEPSKDNFQPVKNDKSISKENEDLDLISEQSNNTIENQYLKPKEWKYKNIINFGEIGEKYKTVKDKLNKEEIKKIHNTLKEKKIYLLYKNKEGKYPIFKINKIQNSDNIAKNYIKSTLSSQKQINFSEIEELKKNIFKYRYIFKDNNNFYRCVIFSFLENIILTNNFMFLKELLNEIDDKININNNIIKNNDHLKNELQSHIKIDLIKQLLYILIKYIQINDIKSYEIFIKIYLLYEDFDYGMIFVIRFLLSEYINENKLKIYSEENKIEIINLLPQKYNDMKISVEKKFELFYFNELFKMDSYDCKIVYFIIPYFFDINLKIISYYYGLGNPIYNKMYRKENNIYTVELLSYKGSFDVCYNKKYYESHSYMLNLFEEDENENLMLFKKNSFKSDYENNDNINKKNNLKENNNKISNKEDLTNKSFICENCSIQYKGKENKLKFCPKCLDEEFKIDILKLYGLYLQYVDHNYKRYPIQIDKYFGTIIHTIKIKDVTIYEAMNGTGYLVYKILEEVKKEICLICRKDTKSNFYYELPCKCRLCSKKCFKKYINIMIYKDFDKLSKNDYKRQKFIFDFCICGKRYYYDDLLTLYFYFQKKNKLKNCEMLIKIVKNRWKWKCAKCDRNFDPFCMNYKLTLFDKKINEDFYEKYFNHLICGNCFDVITVTKKKFVECMFCNSVHKIIDSERLNYQNKSDDSCCFF